jgi:hypothetical protein
MRSSPLEETAPLPAITRHSDLLTANETCFRQCSQQPVGRPNRWSVRSGAESAGVRLGCEGFQHGAARTRRSEHYLGRLRRADGNGFGFNAHPLDDPFDGLLNDFDTYGDGAVRRGAALLIGRAPTGLRTPGRWPPGLRWPRANWQHRMASRALFRLHECMLVEPKWIYTDKSALSFRDLYARGVMGGWGPGRGLVSGRCRK